MEGLMLKQKLQYFGHRMRRADSFEKTLMLGKIEGRRRRGRQRMRWLDSITEGHGFGWILGVGDGQGGLVCCGSWGGKELDLTERVNWIELKDRIEGILECQTMNWQSEILGILVGIWALDGVNRIDRKWQLRIERLIWDYGDDYREKGHKVIITGVIIQKSELFRGGCIDFVESHGHRDLEQPEMLLERLPRTLAPCAVLLFLLLWPPHRDWGTEPETDAEFFRFLQNVSQLSIKCQYF